jgi:hypothetical protein
MTEVISVYFDGSPVDVTAYTRSVSIRRGRSRELDRFTTGTANIVFNNEDRRFDPLYSAGPYFGQIRPRLRVTVSNDGINLFDGVIEDWNLDYELSGKSNASILCVDALAFLAQTRLDEFTNIYQFPGERIGTIVSRPEVAYSGSTNLDFGFAALQEDEVAANTDTLSYLDKVVATDFGRLFVDGSGVLRYRERTSGIISSPRVIFASTNDPYVQQLATLSESVLWFDTVAPSPLRLDAAALAQIATQDSTDTFPQFYPDYIAPVVGFSDIAVELGSEFLFNRIQITRAGGDVQIASNDSSITTFGVRTYAADGLLFVSDTDTADFADFLATLYSEPDVRVAGHTILLHGLDTLTRRYIQRLEIGDVVRTIFAPNNVGFPFDTLSLVEGIEHSIGIDTHTFRVQLTPLDTQGFILDDLSRGLLDTSELGY